MAVSKDTRKNTLLLIVLLASQLLLMSFSARNSQGVSALESGAMRASSPFVAISRWVSGLFENSASSVRGVLSAHSRNERLEAEIEALTADLQTYREARSENQRLRRLLEMREELVPRSVAARVVTARLTAGERLIVVDRGSADGVAEDHAVIAWGGAVGKTLSVSKHYTKVRLLSDPSSGVGGVIQRSRSQGAVEGIYGGTALNMLYVPRFADVVHGDRVVTSGMDGIFPRGFGIGRVVSIRDSPAAGTQTIRLEPEMEFAKIEEVLILLDRPGTELEQDEAATGEEVAPDALVPPAPLEDPPAGSSADAETDGETENPAPGNAQNARPDDEEISGAEARSGVDEQPSTLIGGLFGPPSERAHGSDAFGSSRAAGERAPHLTSMIGRPRRDGLQAGGA